MFIDAALEKWTKAWSVGPAALEHLKQLLGASTGLLKQSDMSEGAVQSRVRLAASKKGLTMWRNNVGAALDGDGRPIRYGLCNDTKAMNTHMKSSDLIGITPVTITQDMVGCTIGQFTAFEVKRGDWYYKGSDREQAQLNFILLVTALGGRATFINNEADVK